MDLMAVVAAITTAVKFLNKLADKYPSEFEEVINESRNELDTLVATKKGRRK